MWEAGGDEHPYVEIAGIKWATMNIGAESETDVGLYFQWGDTQGYTASQVGSGNYQKPFDSADYKFWNGTTPSSPFPTGFLKYNAIDNKTTLDLSDDAARLYWGEYWRMPTGAEFEALISATNASALYSGGNLVGIILTDKTDSSKELIFPVGGYAAGAVVGNTTQGFYHTSSLMGEHVSGCFIVYNDNGEAGAGTNGAPRVFGCNIRPVLDEPI